MIVPSSLLRASARNGRDGDEGTTAHGAGKLPERSESVSRACLLPAVPCGALRGALGASATVFGSGNPITAEDARNPLARAGGGQLPAPLDEAMAHVGDGAQVGAVLGERGVGDLGQRSERVGEQQPAEAQVGCCGQLQQLLPGVTAAGDGGVRTRLAETELACPSGPRSEVEGQRKVTCK